MKCPNCNHTDNEVLPNCTSCQYVFSLAEILHGLIESRGKEVLLDSYVLKSLLADLCKDRHFDRNVLNVLLSQSIGQRMLDLSHMPNFEESAYTYESVLSETFNENKVHYIVDSFYYAISGKRMSVKATPEDESVTLESTTSEIVSSEMSINDNQPKKQSPIKPVDTNSQKIQQSASITNLLQSKQKTWIIAALVILVLVILIPSLSSRNKENQVHTSQQEYSEDTTNDAVDEVVANAAVPSIELAAERVQNVSCSSSQPDGSYGRSFSAQMAIDGQIGTCWMASSGNDQEKLAGAGNWIMLDFGKTKTVRGVRIINGNCWDGYHDGEKVYDDLYNKNGRAKEIEMCFSNGSSTRISLKDANTTSFDDNTFVFSSPVETSFIKFNIISGYPGYKYPTVVCIAEIEAF